MLTISTPPAIDYDDIRQQFAEEGRSNLEKLHATLAFMEEIINQDLKIKEWILKRKRSRSAFKVEDVHKCPVPSVGLMGHNPGNNKVILFSILLRGSPGENRILEPCITQDEYQHQSDHSSGFHWNRIITGHRMRTNTAFSNGFSPEGFDSIWIAHMCNRMSTLEDTRKFLFMYIQYMNEIFRKNGEF